MSLRQRRSSANTLAEASGAQPTARRILAMHGTRSVRSTTCSPGKPLPGQGRLVNPHFGLRPQSMATLLDRGFQFLQTQSSAPHRVTPHQGPLRGGAAGQHQPSALGLLYPDAVLRRPPPTTKVQHRPLPLPRLPKADRVPGSPVLWVTARRRRRWGTS